MKEEIGKTAGAIWQALSTQGELSLTRLKNQLKAPSSTGPSIGWRAKTRLSFRPRGALSESARKGDGRFTRFECFPCGKQG